jgi:hypothetical protein
VNQLSTWALSGAVLGSLGGVVLACSSNGSGGSCDLTSGTYDMSIGSAGGDDGGTCSGLAMLLSDLTPPFTQSNSGPPLSSEQGCGSVSQSGCTYSVTCELSDAGLDYSTSVSVNSTGTGATGTLTFTTSKGVSCSFPLTITKQ